MKIKTTYLLLIFFFSTISIAQIPPSEEWFISKLKTPFEKTANTTATYHETIAYYKRLDQQFPQMELKTYGMTDAGHPLHLAIISNDGDFDPKSIREKGKQILMINNAIHAGEPCGVDATMMWLRDVLTQEEKQKWLEHNVIIAIPMYNIGGALNRNSTTRTNQNGPASYGFRGNAKNLDLNRDFIKCDSRNAQTFNQLFNEWQPNIFIDNHTSNGADYQYTMTLITTQIDKLELSFRDYLRSRMLPKLYEDMKSRNWEMTPYVYNTGKPNNHIMAFLDLPRYSSGYAALHNTISFMPETHMLKPFKDRVQSTYTFMDCMLQLMHEDFSSITQLKKIVSDDIKSKKSFDLNWEVDSKNPSKVLFKGYEAAYKPSDISGEDRLYYDQTKPFEKDLPYLDKYKPTLSVNKPVAYLIPQAYHRVIDRLQWNGVKLQRLTKDQTVEAEFYRIGKVETRNFPYEGHYLHQKVAVEKEVLKRNYFKGDYVVFVDQIANRYIVETLEPQAPDSFFAWNFFDGILMQKEYYSSYVFEDLAANYLKQQPDLKKRLEAKKLEDPTFAKSGQAQLDFIYKNSPHYEPTHRLYPVARFIEDAKILSVE